MVEIRFRDAPKWDYMDVPHYKRTSCHGLSPQVFCSRIFIRRRTSDEKKKHGSSNIPLRTRASYFEL